MGYCVAVEEKEDEVLRGLRGRMVLLVEKGKAFHGSKNNIMKVYPILQKCNISIQFDVDGKPHSKDTCAVGDHRAFTRERRENRGFQRVLPTELGKRMETRWSGGLRGFRRQWRRRRK
ncbi:uncharacterized protein HKW66_Vig0049720 [Vigna angularis]|uniref:Uncharacterized protein n=1 Tax=Phaseolus angularis TaxID=3914 RepID=A0A8T0L0K2_PHAAN|nr:uncharacterized protein HKW66_Vig0049720 [Vigna angularis]